MERTRGDEKNVVGANHAVASVYSSAFYDRKNVALYTFARHIGAVTRFAARDLVNLIDEDDAHLLGAFDG